MSKKAYIGIGNTAAKVKKIYFGVGGVAKKVRKAYIGVGGKAKQWWPRTINLEFGQELSSLTYATCRMASARTNDRVIFAGGRGRAGDTGFANGRSANVYSYNSSMTFNKLTDLSAHDDYPVGNSFAGRAVFAISDRSTSDPESSIKSICTYNNSGTKANLSSRNTMRMQHFAMAGNDNYLFLGGGSIASGSDYVGAPTNVERYNSSFTKVDDLLDVYSGGNGTQSSHIMGATAKDKVLLASKSGSVSYFTFNSDGTQGTTIHLMHAYSSSYQQGMSFNNCALFTGTYDGDEFSNWQTVDIVDSSLTVQSLPISYSYDDLTLRATGCTDYYAVIFSGRSLGDTYNSGSITNYIDENFTVHELLTVGNITARYNSSACGLSDILIIAGGQLMSGSTSGYNNCTTEAYSIIET